MATTDHAARALALFDELVELDAAARAARLSAIDDRALADELARMLAADDSDTGVLDREAPRLPATGAPGQRIGAFVIERMLGRGGMGEVWLAGRAERGFEQQVALKLLRRGLDPEDALRRFAQERRILAGLTHPDIARFIDGGVTAEGVSWYAMEYVDGVPITAYAQAHALTVRERVALLARVAVAVAYAQNRLIVHRDLKPSNILVDAAGAPHLLDFGIAKLLAAAPGAEETATGLRAMSPAYAAPEQVLDEPIGTATDVYALGVVLYELLTGALPHAREAGSLEALADRVRTETTERPSARTRGIGGELDLIVLTALRREPERRYASAAALADDLARWLDGRPIAAQADSAAYRLRKFVARHRLGVASGAAAALALIVGSGVALWQARVAQDEARRAAAELARAESIKTFALSLFREQDPLARGKPAPRSASELVALGIERARKQFAGDPARRDEILNDLGEIQVSLGDAAAARPVLEEVVRSRAPGSIEHAAAESNLGAALVVLGETAPGRAMFERASATLVARAGPDDPLTLKARGRLAKAILFEGRAAEALAMLEDLVARNERVFGRDAMETLVVLSDLGSVQENLDKLDAAEATGRDVIARLERVVGPDHAQLVRPLGRLGDILRRRQKYDETDALYSRAIGIARAQKAGPLTGLLLMRHGDLLRRLKRFDEAEREFDEATSLLPPNTAEQAQVQMFRASTLHDRGDLAGAAAAFKRAHELFLGALGADAVFPWYALIQHAACERERGHGAAVEALLLKSDAAIRRIAGPDSYDTMNAATNVAAWRVEQGRHADAAQLYREALTIATKMYGNEHTATIDARIGLAESLAALATTETLAQARTEVSALPPLEKLTADARTRVAKLKGLTSFSASP